MAKTSPKPAFVLSLFAGLGYISIILQWLWVTALYLPVLLENQAVRDFITPTPSEQTAQAIQLTDTSSPIVMIVAVIVTFLVLVVTVVVLIRLPLSIARASEQTVDKSVDKIVPIVTHHKKIPMKKQERIRFKIRSYMKLALAIIPFICLFGTYAVSLPISSDIVFVVGGFLLAGTTLWFGLEYAVARLLKLPYRDIV